MERALTTPKNPSRAYRLAVKTIGAKNLAPKLGKSLQHVYRMAADEHCEETRNHPFTQTYKLGKEMIKKGLYASLFVGISPIVNKLLKCKMVPLDSVPDKEHYHEELVDLSCSVSDLMETAKMYLNNDATEAQLREAEFAAYDAVGQFTEKAFLEKRNTLS